MAGNPMFNPRNLGAAMQPGVNPMDAAVQGEGAPPMPPQKKKKSKAKKPTGKKAGKDKPKGGGLVY